MNIFNKISNSFSKKERTFSTGVKADESVENHFSNRSTTNILRHSGVAFQTDAYDLCPPIQACIDKKSRATIRGKLIPVDGNGAVLKTTPLDFVKALNVIEHPNIYQNKNQFISMFKTFLEIYGVVYVFKIKSLGFDDVSGLIIIPNNCVLVNYNTPMNIFTNSENQIRSISVNIFGMSFVFSGDLLRKNIEVVYDNTFNLTSGYEYQPKSKIDTLYYPIVNIIGSLESRNHIIVKRGTDGILSPEKSADPTSISALMDKTERKRLQDDFAKYGYLSDQFMTLITKVPMKYQSTVKNVSDLGLFDGENADHQTIASRFGVPTPLLSLPDTTKFNTYGEAKKEFYEDTIMPESEVLSAFFDKVFDSKSKGFKFYFDYSYLEFMQKSLLQNAQTLNMMITALNSAISTELVSLNDAKRIINDYLS